MRNSLYLAAVGALISFALGDMVESAHATGNYVVHFHGTRAQVRSACGGADDTKTEGGNYTSCSSGTTGNSVTCDDKGNCTGTYTGLVRGGGIKIPRANAASVGGILAP